MRMTDTRKSQASYGFVWGTIHMLARAGLPGNGLTAHPTVESAPTALQQRAENMADALGIDTVDLLVWEHDVPNALPFGDRSGGTLVLTTGLIDLLEDDELDAAMLHELAHVRHGHGRRFGVMVAAMLGVVGLLSSRARTRRCRAAWLGIGVGVCTLLGLAAVRRYELEADRTAREHLDDPAALARAIVAVRTGSGDVDLAAYDPPQSSRLERLFLIYPPPADRFPEYIEHRR